MATIIGMYVNFDIYEKINSNAQIYRDAILWACECEQVNQGNLFKNILLMSTKYYLTHMMKTLVTFGIFYHVSWMNNFLG